MHCFADYADATSWAVGPLSLEKPKSSSKSFQYDRGRICTHIEHKLQTQRQIIPASYKSQSPYGSGLGRPHNCLDLPLCDEEQVVGAPVAALLHIARELQEQVARLLGHQVPDELQREGTTWLKGAQLRKEGGPS